MPAIIVYSTGSCPYCVRACRLLDAKGLPYTEVRVDRDPERRSEMQEKSRRRSVPQIFIGDYHVGGFNELYLLDKSGQLNALLDAGFKPG